MGKDRITGVLERMIRELVVSSGVLY